MDISEPASDCSRPTAMADWINGAIDTLRRKNDNNNSLTTPTGIIHHHQDDKKKIICSREYMSCAFIIAHSLANQLSAIEEQSGYEGGGGGGNGLQQQRRNNNNPVNNNLNDELRSSKKCIIYVNCGTSNIVEENREQPKKQKRPSFMKKAWGRRKKNNMDDGQGGDNIDHRDNNTDGGEVQSLSNQLSSLLDADGQSSIGSIGSIEYLNIKGATLLNEVTRSPLSYDGRREINALGAVFYELFSGGQLQQHPQKQQSVTSSWPLDQLAELEDTSGSQSSDSYLKSIPALSIPFDYSNTDTHGLQSAMDLIDAIGDDDELFGGNSDGRKKIVAGDDAVGLDDNHLSTTGKRRNKEFMHQPKRRFSHGDNSNSHDESLQKSQRNSSESISVERLKSLGLPTTLCDLIRNMIDSSTSDGEDLFVDDETYMSMIDVRDDLKALMENSELYMREVDIAHASRVGIQFEDGVGGEGERTSFYGRDAELETLKECYHRTIAGECEVAMISGPSGIGKSKLSEEFARYVTTQSGSAGIGGGVRSLFLSGRFDKLQKDQPFHVISSAFDKYCTWLYDGDDPSLIQKVSSALIDHLGEELSSLVAAMPNLASILGSSYDSGKKNEEKIEDAADAQKRLRYLFCQFVEIISRCHGVPVVLFLDDCQWIDSGSVALLNQMLIMSSSAIKNHHFFFYGSCRDDEMNDQHPLTIMLSSVGNFGTKTTKIQLTSMDKDTVNKMLSTTLALLPRLTRPLADILHHKTKGSPFFVKQLMIELCKQQLLYPSLLRRRWVWDANRIRDMEIPENVAIFITKSFDRLPPEVVSALNVLSFFGTSADVRLMQLLEVETKLSLVDLLDSAVAASVLGKRNGDKEFYFLHDKLQEAAYSVTKPDMRCLQHFQYGLTLGNIAVRDHDDNLLITAVGQINHGGPKAVIDGEQGLAVAKLNLDAGKRAMVMCDFFSAYSFFDCGISYLRKGHWRDNYDLSLELFNLASKCAFMNAEYTSLKLLNAQIMRYAKCFEDKLPAILISVTLLTWSGKVSEAIKVMTNTLANLGEEPPAKITSSLLKRKMKSAKEKLDRLSEEALLACHVMENPMKIMAMELLVKLYENYTFTGDTALLPFISMKMIEISLKHGMGPLSPIAFAQYSNYLALVEKEYEVSRRYVKFALYLTKKSRARIGDVMYYCNHSRLVTEPIQSAIELYLETYKVAMKSGATKYAIGSCYVNNVYSFWTGKKLDAVVQSMTETMALMKYHKHMLMITLLLPLFRVALRLMGESDMAQQSGVTDIFGETLKEEEYKLPSHRVAKGVLNIYEALIFRDLEKTTEFFEQLFETDDHYESLGRGVLPMFPRVL
jgi:predicted ATPase